MNQGRCRRPRTSPKDAADQRLRTDPLGGLGGVFDVACAHALEQCHEALLGPACVQERQHLVESPDLSMVPPVSVVSCFTLLPFWRYPRSITFPAFRFAVLANTVSAIPLSIPQAALVGTKYCTPETDTSEIIVDVQWHFPMDAQLYFPTTYHTSVVFSKGLSLSQWMFS